ncbi:hypothetical protein [Leisingera sp. M658]|uniref:hypothetical protein n=1 Tax=Leisingera sp. M658 TaxID=2867015 RepID=UPI0021A514D7|nr:hypothetical protein [Leisingera sp. M658]UWQ74406.1 hypothetical protein K3724_18280 [Leisingera sp. M658]
MPIALQTINLGLSLAGVALHAGRRLDRIFAEKAVVNEPLAWPETPTVQVQSLQDFVEALRDAVQEEENRRTAGKPLWSDAQLETARLARDNENFPDVVASLQDVAPSKIPFVDTRVDATSIYLAALEEAGLVEDTATARQAVYFLVGGKDNRQQSTAWQVGTVLLSATAQFTLSTQEQLIKNPRQRQIVAKVLERLATPELLEVANGRSLLAELVGATLNGVVDAAEVVKFDTPWLDGLLDALADARHAQPEEKRDDFLVGLTRGQGYRQLVAEILEEGSTQLSSSDQKGLTIAISGFLTSASEVVRSASSMSLETFFVQHWPDLARAGFRAARDYGPSLVQGQNPFLGKVLISAFNVLSETPGRDFLTQEALEATVESAIAAIAANPELIDEDWPKLLFGSVASIVADTGLRSVFDDTFLDRFARELARSAASSPQLITFHSEATTEMVRLTLLSLADLAQPSAKEIAEAVLIAGLETASAYPSIFIGTGGASNGDFANAVGSITRQVAEMVRAKGISQVTGASLASLAVGMVARNPRLFVQTKSDLAAAVIAVVAETIADAPAMLVSEHGLVKIAEAALAGLALHGKSLLGEASSADELTELLKPVVREALILADREIGVSVDMASVPDTIAGLIALWLNGKLVEISAGNTDFVAHFRAVAHQVNSA